MLNWQLWCEAINNVTQTKYELQKEYCNSIINEARGDSKDTWKALKEIWPTKNKNSHVNNIEGFHEDFDMANAMNKHFATVGENLSKEFPPSEEYLLPSTVPTFNLLHVSPTNVMSHLNSLSASKSCGTDGLTAGLLKDSGDAIVLPLTHIFNLSIGSNFFPNTWKVALVTPLFKDGDKSKANNYRLISLLPIISKLPKKVVHEQVYAFLRHRQYFCEQQSGFRKGHSTTTCL